ncbi:hypothetical protein K431DRAFT_339875 [Polychaeton citri CBS 116435]|uniref:Uncharacterized protein n=1 Tax=Polychaeton citri CBS 116435 TaxID=1314669 RepID=A0A9P4UP65_9PEZI|nr:hypothetical protein K431DRAFT_339875 [Polychaeton citri CBS 116435]
MYSRIQALMDRGFGDDDGSIRPIRTIPAFAPISDNENRAWIIIATALGLPMTLLSSTLGAFIRSTINRGWGPDDIALAASTAISWVQSSLILAACSKGLGTSLQEIPLIQLYYASNLLFLVSLGLSKISGFLLALLHIMLGLVAIWTLAALFAVAFQCGGSQPWLVASRSCGSSTALEDFACIFELAIISLDNELVIVSAFTFRLGLIIVAGFRVGAFDKAGLSLDPTLLEASFICWTHTEMNYSIISTTIPSATSFFKSLSTNYGIAHGVTSENASYAHGSRLDGKSHAESTLGKSTRRTSRKLLESIALSCICIPKDQFQGIATHDEDIIYGPGYVANASSDMRDRTNSQLTDAKSFGSHDSQQMIIRKDVAFQIQCD